MWLRENVMGLSLDDDQAARPRIWVEGDGTIILRARNVAVAAFMMCVLIGLFVYQYFHHHINHHMYLSGLEFSLCVLLTAFGFALGFHTQRYRLHVTEPWMHAESAREPCLFKLCVHVCATASSMLSVTAAVTNTTSAYTEQPTPGSGWDKALHNKDTLHIKHYTSKILCTIKQYKDILHIILLFYVVLYMQSVLCMQCFIC